MDYNSQKPIQVIIPEKSASTEATYNTIPTYASYQPPVTNVYTDVQESTYISSPPQPVPMIPLPAVPLVFPLMEAPSGPMISVYVEDNSHHQKRNRRIVGVGVAAAACAATGGLVLIPALAGLAVNKVVKKKREKCVYAYGNTYIYELRAALARGLGVPPELLQLKRKGVFLDDLSRVCVTIWNLLENNVFILLCMLRTVQSRVAFASMRDNTNILPCSLLIVLRINLSFLLFD